MKIKSYILGTMTNMNQSHYEMVEGNRTSQSASAVPCFCSSSKIPTHVASSGNYNYKNLLPNCLLKLQVQQQASFSYCLFTKLFTTTSSSSFRVHCLLINLHCACIVQGTLSHQTAGPEASLNLREEESS